MRHQRRGSRMYTHDPLTVAVDERGGDLAVITPAGELDMATAPKLDQALRNAERRYEVVVLDLARLTFIDSSGIRTIFRTAQRAREGLFAFTIKPGSPTIMRTLEVLGLTAQLPIHGQPVSRPGCPRARPAAPAREGDRRTGDRRRGGAGCAPT